MLPLRRGLSVFVLVTALLAGSVTGAPATSAAAGKGLRGRMLDLINRTRDRHDARALRLNIDLSRYARRHSARMADRGELFHSTHLRRQLRGYRYSTWGEILGYAGTLRRVRDLWMDSSTHRKLLLGRAFRRAGVGVVRRGGMVWVTVILYG
jgi:uncharacterized protein YkwD